jgi:regulator of replication initiation timing
MEGKSNVEGITRNQLWEVINENTQLKQENYMLKAKLQQIEKLVNNYDIYE